MTLPDLLARVSQLLEQAGIPYMVAGSLASSYHGEPRATRDLDVVIDPSGESLELLLEALPRDEFYVDDAAAREALAERGQFNVVEITSGWKVDFVIRKERPFSTEELKRRRRAEVLGTPSWVASAEDTIIAKLEWARSGESERQLRDVAGILSVSGGELDREYLERWIAQLGLGDLWSRVSDGR